MAVSQPPRSFRFTAGLVHSFLSKGGGGFGCFPLAALIFLLFFSKIDSKATKSPFGGFCRVHRVCTLNVIYDGMTHFLTLFASNMTVFDLTKRTAKTTKNRETALFRAFSRLV